MPQLKTFHHGRQVDAPFFQDRPTIKRELVHGVRFDLLAHRGTATGQEAGPRSVGDRTEAKVDAGGLNLLFVDRLGCLDLTTFDRFAQSLGRDDTRGMHRLHAWLRLVHRKERMFGRASHQLSKQGFAEIAIPGEDQERQPRQTTTAGS